MWWLLSVYMIGFFASAGVIWFTGGEKHLRKGDVPWIWFNTAIWPFWWALFGYAAIKGRLEK